MMSSFPRKAVAQYKFQVQRLHTGKLQAPCSSAHFTAEAECLRNLYQSSAILAPLTHPHLVYGPRRYDGQLLFLLLGP